MREHPNVWSKVSCPERLSVTGPKALNGEQAAYQDVVPFARRVVQEFPDRVLWGTDWPHPNLKDHMPDDGLLVDFIPHIAPTAELQQSCWSPTHEALLAQGGLRWHSTNPTWTCPAPSSLMRAKPQRLLAQPVLHEPDEGREPRRFKANERAYLDEWAMTEEQKQAVLAAT